MGEPWEGSVLEIGCGEGDLGKMLWDRDGNCYHGIDYSKEAIAKAHQKYPTIPFTCSDYRTHVEMNMHWDRIVMQGILEHLDNPFTELKWMMDNLLADKGDVITSSPCFLNPRGIVWMTLDMLGAVMSKTDLHYLNPCDFQNFCYDNSCLLEWDTCDYSWAHDVDMITDLKKRIPLALKDGGIPYSEDNLSAFIEWLDCRYFPTNHGATVVYRISK